MKIFVFNHTRAQPEYFCFNGSHKYSTAVILGLDPNLMQMFQIQA